MFLYLIGIFIYCVRGQRPCSKMARQNSQQNRFSFIIFKSIAHFSLQVPQSGVIVAQPGYPAQQFTTIPAQQPSAYPAAYTAQPTQQQPGYPAQQQATYPAQQPPAYQTQAAQQLPPPPSYTDSSNPSAPRESVVFGK